MIYFVAIVVVTLSLSLSLTFITYIQIYITYILHIYYIYIQTYDSSQNAVLFATHVVISKRLPPGFKSSRTSANNKKSPEDLIYLLRFFFCGQLARYKPIVLTNNLNLKNRTRLEIAQKFSSNPWTLEGFFPR